MSSLKTIETARHALQVLLARLPEPLRRQLTTRNRPVLMSEELISDEQVRATVKDFWGTFVAKNTDRFSELYDPVATIWSSTAERVEPGRLAVVRRSREYFENRGDLYASVKDPIEVEVFGNIAVAAYTFEFYADKGGNGDFQVGKERIRRGRATQVFLRDDRGQLRIIHEHLSQPAKGDNP